MDGFYNETKVRNYHLSAKQSRNTKKEEAKLSTGPILQRNLRQSKNTPQQLVLKHPKDRIL